MKRIGLFFWKIIVTIARSVLSMLYKIFGKELTDEAFEGWLQFIKFGMVGVLNTLINYVITEVGYIALLKIINDRTLSLQISQTAGFIITVFISYLINNAVVFKKEEGQTRNPIKTLVKTYVAYSVTGLFLNNLLIYMEINIFNMSALIAPLINIIIDVPINFFLNKLWAYKAD